jgi:2-hydroxy-6-oxonona-2,4-dienedioate hydrolase
MTSNRRSFLKTSVVGLAALPSRVSARSPQDSIMNNPKFVDVEGIRTRYFEGGSGEPLVLIHGGSIGSFMYIANAWSLNLDPLSENFHVYAPDKLGQGYTDNPKRDADYTMEAQTLHILNFMRTLGIRKATMVGHSRGALPIARIAIDHPELVKNLISLNSRTLSPLDPAIGNRVNPFYTKLEENAPPVPNAEYVRREPDANSYFQHHITDEYVNDILEVALSARNQQAKGKMEQLGKQYVTNSTRLKEQTLDDIRAGKLKAPVLILWGLNDESAPLDLGIQLLSTIASAHPETQMHVLNQAKHYVNRDQPKKFNGMVTAFAKKLSSS